MARPCSTKTQLLDRIKNLEDRIHHFEQQHLACCEQITRLTGERDQLEKKLEQRTDELKKIRGTLTRQMAHRQQAESALADERNMLRTLIDAIPDHIYIKDTDGIFQLCNRNMADDLGLMSPLDIIGKSDFDFLQKEVAENYRRQEQQILRTGKPMINEEHSGIGRFGSDSWFFSSKAPLCDHEGNIIGIVGANRDTTKRKLTEQKLNQYHEKIAQTEQITELAALSATIAHELNQPLTVIQLLIQDNLSELEKSPDLSRLRNNLEETLREIDVSNEIIKRYRNMLQPPVQGGLQSVDLNHVAVRIAKALRMNAQQNKINISVEQLEALPKIRGKMADFEQLFFILIQNAIQAADAQKWRHLKIIGRCNRDNIEMQFSDNCSGIAPEHLSKIFDLFFTTKPRDMGTGFGLYIVRRILRTYDGAIQVISRLNHGTCFTITLPNADKDLPGDSAVHS